MQLTLRPRTVVRWLAALIVVLVLLGVAGEIVERLVAHGTAARVAHLVSLDAEWNLASWYATLTLLASAVLLAVIWVHARRAGRPFAAHWGLAALGFLYLALDEGVGLHELFSLPFQRLFGTSGWLHFAWVIPASAVCAVIGLASIPFLRHLPRATAIQFGLAAAVYLAGAIGMELVSGTIVSSENPDTWVYTITASVEEVLEMTGVLIFIRALLAYLAAQTDEIRIVIGPPASR